jgi:hypothetical protein
MFTNNRIAWSPTRGRLLDNCSRRYVLEHVIATDDEFIRKKAKARRIVDHARFALRDAIIHRMEEVDTPMNELRTIIHRNLLRAVITGEVLEEEPHCRLDQSVDMMMHRMSLFFSAPLIGFNRKSSNEIVVVDRFQPLLLDGARQYGAPDFLVENGGRLCLVRLAMEIGSRTPDRATELELGSMLLWAQRNPMIKHEIDDIDIVRIGWLGTRWVKWKKSASIEWEQQSRSMISMDIEQMARLMIFDGDIESLPRSKSAWRCMHCSFQDECPGVDFKEKKQGLRLQIPDLVLS